MRLPLSLLALIGCANPGWLGVPLAEAPLDSRAFSEWAGAAEHQQFGAAVGAAGDGDGDGLADLAIAATDWGLGAVWFLPGGSGAPAGDLPEPLPEGPCGEGYAGFGTSLAAADVDADGFDDLLVGSTTSCLAVYSGSSLGPVYGIARELGDPFGESHVVVAPAGDVDGDGYADVVAGDYGDGDMRGSAWVLLGSAAGLSVVPAATWSGTEWGDLVGKSVTGAGDVDGDGYDDVAVGACGVGHPAWVSLYRGSPTGPEATAGWTLFPDDGDTVFGWSITAADVNGDGWSDLAIGSYGHDLQRGAVYVYFGSVAGPASEPSVTWIGEAEGDDFGTAVSSAGDLDGDGYDDLVVGAPGAAGGDGRAYVYRGGVLPSATPAAVWSGVGAFGAALVGLGDATGDGVPDVLVGAPGAPTSGVVTLHTCADPLDVECAGWLPDAGGIAFGLTPSVGDGALLRAGESEIGGCATVPGTPAWLLALALVRRVRSSAMTTSAPLLDKRLRRHPEAVDAGRRSEPIIERMEHLALRTPVRPLQRRPELQCVGGATADVSQNLNVLPPVPRGQPRRRLPRRGNAAAASRRAGARCPAERCRCARVRPGSPRRPLCPREALRFRSAPRSVRGRRPPRSRRRGRPEGSDSTCSSARRCRPRYSCGPSSLGNWPRRGRFRWPAPRLGTPARAARAGLISSHGGAEADIDARPANAAPRGESM